MKKQILMALVCASVSTASMAQYSNATLNGPWFAYIAPIQPYGDSLLYLVFDGNGGITELGLFCDGNSTYNVTSSGSISGTFDCDGGMPFTGQFYSQDSAMINVAGIPSTWRLVRLSDPGALEGILSGTLTTQNCGSYTSVFLQIDNNGVVIGSSGLMPPVSGRVYSYQGVFNGHFKTGGSNGWQEFTIKGYQSGTSLWGELDPDWNNCGSTNVQLELSAAGIANDPHHTMDLSIFPNPAATNIMLHLEGGIHGTTSVNIFDSVGKLVSTHNLQRDQQQLDISTLGDGSYLVQVIAADRVGTQRLVVQR